jgi:type VI secretion system protein ImpC
METPRPIIGMSITSDPDETRVEAASRSMSTRESLDRVRILLVADLDPAAIEVDWAAGDRRRSFDNADVNAWMQELRPRIELSVPNRLSSGLERITFDFVADSLSAFSPARIAERVPALASARAMREALTAARDGSIGRQELETRLADAGMSRDAAAGLVRALAPRQPGSPHPGDDDALGRLLGMMDIDGGGDGAPEQPRTHTETALDALVDAVASGAAPEVDRETADSAIADLDQRYRDQLDAILSDPEFRRLEAAWRGLKFLVDRADFRGGMRVEALAASREQLHDAIHHQVLMPEYSEGAERPPLAAVIVDFPFSASPADMGALGDLAASGASMQVPFVATVDAAFFGFEQPTDLSRLGPLRQHLATEQYIGFRKLRERPDAQFLALALPAFLLRDPHTEGDWTESGQLWGGGALLAGAALCASHAQTGWPTHLGDRKIENLPIRRTRMGGIPAAAAFADRVAADMAEFGFFAFRAPLNRDHVVAGYPAVLRRPQGQDGVDARAQASLPAAVFTALAAHLIIKMQGDMTSPRTPSVCSTWMSTTTRSSSSSACACARLAQS